MRRALVERVSVGVNRLDDAQSHHVRDVLRMRVGDQLELFDAFGACGSGRISSLEPLLVEIEQLAEQQPTLTITIASAVPKGERADWLVEKLSELGVACWVPMRTERSVVLPKGVGKPERWQRIAAESAKQSRRVGVMKIEPLTSLDDCLNRLCDWRLIADATSPNACPMPEVLRAWQAVEHQAVEHQAVEHQAVEHQAVEHQAVEHQAVEHQPVGSKPMGSVLCLIGPEGGFTTDEVRRAESRGFRAVRLTGTVLRVETAAVLAAGLMLVGASA